MKGLEGDDMGIPVIRHHLLRHRPLYYGLLGGFAGVLLDADHIPSYYFVSITPRPMHWLAFWLACGFVIYYCACLGRLLCQTILKGGK